MAEILLLEDMEPLRRILTAALREAGHNVTAFEDGSITSDAVALDSFDVMVTDLIMPNVDGLQSIRFVKQHNPDLKIIAMTGHDFGLEEEDLSTAKELGAAATFRKPLEPQALVNAIEEMLAI